MTITNRSSGTNVREIAEGIYRINTPTDIAGGFSFNQYLIVDDAPLLFHTGLKKLFPLVREAVESVMPVKNLRYIGFSHFEADECGSLNEWLAAAPHAIPVCSQAAACMHGSAWKGDAAVLLRALGDRFAGGMNTQQVTEVTREPKT